MSKEKKHPKIPKKNFGTLTTRPTVDTGNHQHGYYGQVTDRIDLMPLPDECLKCAFKNMDFCSRDPSICEY